MDAAARGALRTDSRADGRDAFAWLDGRGAESAGNRFAGECEAVRFYWISRATLGRARRDDSGDRARGNPAGHAEICKAAAHVVPQRGRRSLVRRVWPRSEGTECRAALSAGP